MAEYINQLSRGFEGFIVDVVSIKDMMPQIIDVFNVSHSDWKMNRANMRYRRGREYYNVSISIPYNDDGLNGGIIGLSTMGFSLTLFVSSAYKPYKYKGLKILGPGIAVMPDLYPISSTIMGMRREESDRFMSVTVEQIGYNRDTFSVPDILLFGESMTQHDVIIKQINECLMPAFINPPDNAYKVYKAKNNIEEDEDYFIDDESTMMFIFMSVNRRDENILPTINSTFGSAIIGGGRVEEDKELVYDKELSILGTY